MAFSVYPYVALIRGWALLRSGGWPALIDALPPVPARRPSSLPAAETIVRRCARAARRLPMTTRCLERSYGTCATLRRSGLPATLCVGVGRRPPMRFHAWVEVDGRIVNDSPSLRGDFRVICTF